MKQHSLGVGQTAKRTRRRVFLAELEKVVPWAELVALLSPCLPEGKCGRPPFSSEIMLRIHFMQQWFALSDPAMEEALHDMPVFREFAGLEGWTQRLPNESTILRFRHVLEKHKLAAQILQMVNTLLSAEGVMLKSGTVVGTTLIVEPSSTKNSSGKCDPEMKRGHEWYFGTKCHIGVDIESGLADTVKGTSGAVIDVFKVNSLVREGDRDVFSDAAYQGAGKRLDARTDVTLHFGMCPGLRRVLDLRELMEQLTEPLERLKAGIQARVEHASRVVKHQFSHAEVLNAAWPSTRQSCTRCLRRPISGWCEDTSWERRHECVRNLGNWPYGRPSRFSVAVVRDEWVTRGTALPWVQRTGTFRRGLCRPHLRRLVVYSVASLTTLQVVDLSLGSISAT